MQSGLASAAFGEANCEVTEQGVPLPEDEFQTRALRRATYSGQPFGDQAFIEEMRAQREALFARADGAVSKPSGQKVAYATH